MLQRCAAFVGAAGLFVTVACGQTDAGITTSVKSRLAADDTVSAYQVDVDTRDGVVTLSGSVDNAAAREEAIRIARETDGVRDVVDQLRVGEAAPTGGVFDPDVDADPDANAPDAADRVGDAADRAGEAAGNAADRAGTAVGDAGITAAVKSKFLADGAVSGLQIDVDTNQGVVTLTGDVSSRASADRAVRLARETEGVNRVVDNLRVEGTAGR